MLTKKGKISKMSRRMYLRIFGERGKAYPVFIFGEQRSGTNILIDTLRNSKETECFNENDEEAFDNCAIRDTETITEIIRKSYAKTVVFKPICNSQNARRLLGLYLEGKAIWIYRRYQDVVNSSLRAFSDHRSYLHNVLYEPEKAGWRAQNITQENMKLISRFYNKGITDSSARALIWYLRNYQYFQQGLDKEDRIILVNYEWLVTHPRIKFNYVFGFIGLNYRESWTNSVSGSSVKKDSFPEIDPEILKLCDEMFDRLETLSAQRRQVED